jgi:hypothetical protein
MPVYYRNWLLLLFFIAANPLLSFSQSDSIFRIGLILPLQTASTTYKLEAYANAHDVFTANKIHLNEDVVTALDFYQGALEALHESKDSLKIELSVYDNWNSDSVTTVLLKDPALKKLDVIIGSVSTSTAKLVADFCRQNKIVNIQPFSPSKSLTSDNPYHLKMAPSIDAHTDAMFNSIVDSFPGANVIIYTPDVEKSLTITQRFDSLFQDYNQTAEKKFTLAFLNTKDMLLNGKKTSASEQLKPGKRNILIITSFEESFVNGNLRVLHEKLSHDSTIVVYGMPTWLNGEVLRLDYVNDFHTRISDSYVPDLLHGETFGFNLYYAENFGSEPGRYAYLGFDVFNFLLYNLKDYGKGFLENVSTQHYSGAVYKFDITKNLKDKATLNYYENRAVNVFMVENYQLKRVSYTSGF